MKEARHLRVVHWLGIVPAIAICTLCEREFRVPTPALSKLSDAQESLQLQFSTHKCGFEKKDNRGEAA